MFKESALILVAAPVYSAAIAIELIVSNLRAKKVYSFEGVLQNIYLSVINMGLDILIRGVALLTLEMVYDWRVIHWTEGAVYWFALLIRRFYLLLASPDRPSLQVILGCARDTSFIRRVQFDGRFPVVSISTALSFYLLHAAGPAGIQRH